QILPDKNAVILAKQLTKLLLEISESLPKGALPITVVKPTLNEKLGIRCHTSVHGGPKVVPAPSFLAGNENALRSRSKGRFIELKQHRVCLDKRTKPLSVLDQISPVCRI